MRAGDVFGYGFKHYKGMEEFRLEKPMAITREVSLDRYTDEEVLDRFHRMKK